MHAVHIFKDSHATRLPSFKSVTCVVVSRCPRPLVESWLRGEGQSSWGHRPVSQGEHSVGLYPPVSSVVFSASKRDIGVLLGYFVLDGDIVFGVLGPPCKIPWVVNNNSFSFKFQLLLFFIYWKYFTIWSTYIHPNYGHRMVGNRQISCTVQAWSTRKINCLLALQSEI